MEKKNGAVKRDREGRHWLRILRPLILWFALVLVLFAIRTHERLLDKTRLDFEVSFAGDAFGFFQGSTLLDGKPFQSGEHIGLGSHVFTATHPKGETYQTNLSIWYGRHSLGNIALKRTKGTIALEVFPPALFVSIRGPEISFTLTNSAGMTSSVPTDHYQIEAVYPHLREARDVDVSANTSANVSIRPRFGTLHLTSNKTNASFQVVGGDGQTVESAQFPARLFDVPEGNYRLISTHQRSRDERAASIKAGLTNEIEVHFAYGAIEILTDPPGATIIGRDGNELGTTPLHLEEVPAGKLEVRCALNGYEPVLFSFDVVAEQTAFQQTNLVSINYGKSLADAEQYLGARDYDRAFAAATAALQAKPNDSAAQTIQKNAFVKGKIARAQTYGAKRDYAAAIKELDGALRQEPENAEIIRMLADFRSRAAELAEERRQERINRPKQVFDALMGRFTDSPLFESHELKTGRAVTDVRTAITRVLKQQPAFQITRNESTAPETFEIEAQQDTMTALATIASRRKCLIVGGQTSDSETQVLFKVLEYKTEAVEKFSLGNLIGTPASVTFVPIHSSRIANLTEKMQAQVSFGVSNVTARISGALGQNSGRAP